MLTYIVILQQQQQQNLSIKLISALVKTVMNGKIVSQQLQNLPCLSQSKKGEARQYIKEHELSYRYAASIAW